ncbi:hypothetical protein OMP38_07995 [Cohnella ginsengisoli]|uniref:MFS transporter n=1 Tax=Cohnella ginsengisoli TaxID=425004 RepID=A0A9X4KEW4_9BACL|nr:hypothetical protein [Cohnella ginsengisoli]MDG0790808.1 hypothetical protein [Cohnella ginsengisoli]
MGGSVWAGSIILIFVKEVLAENESWWGYINAGSLGGAIAGGLAVYAIADRIKNSFQTSMIVSALLIGLLLLLFAYSSNGWLCLLYAFLAGPAYQLRGIIQKTAYQTCIPPALLPKSFSAFGTLAYMTYGISVVLLSGLADILGIKAVFAVTAVLYGLSAAIPLIKSKRQSASGTINLDG